MPDLRHPSWCSPAHCAAPDALAERGVDEATLPIWQQEHHRSVPRTVSTGRDGDVAFTFSAARWVNQPPTDEVDVVDMTLAFTDRRMEITAPIAPSQITVLAEALGELRDLVVTAGAIGARRSVWVARAIRALVAFGVMCRSEASTLLVVWRHYSQMSPAEVDAVIAHFPEGGAR